MITILLLIISVIFFYFIFIKQNINIENFSNNIGIYVINLQESKNRLKLINSQFNKQNIKFTRFPAVNGKKIDILKLKNDNILHNENMKKGNLGCSLSHLTLWKTLAKKKIIII